MSLLYSILVGCVIFWLTSKIMNLKGWGLILNTLFVIIGSMVGSTVLNFFGFYAGNGFIPSVISGTVGCCVVLAAIKLMNK
ncbi:MAG: GlsB/YeaQ/YmgE family stress response membrane protein [Bacteroidia bacterium]